MSENKIDVKEHLIMVKVHTSEALQKIAKKLDIEITKDISKLYLPSKQIKNRKPIKQKPYHRDIDWSDMYEFNQNDVVIYSHFELYIENTEGHALAEEIFESKITPRTSNIHYPERMLESDRKYRLVSTRGNPQYPIYVISKGRANKCTTAENLLKMEVPFRIVIEKQEWADYAKNFDESILLELDMNFKKEFDPYIPGFDENKSKGSGPARNFVWNHAKQAGYDYHWIIDDNIDGFYFLNNNKRIKVADGGAFAAVEDYINRYDNVGVSGLNYFFFCIATQKYPPFVLNTKVYSCLLINNNIEDRWGGRYNEDVDLCLKVLKNGYSTAQFDILLSDKAATQTCGGGNTDAFYAEEGTLPKSKMLQNNHPDVTRVSWKHKRWHHEVNYKLFDKFVYANINQTIDRLCAKPLISKDSITAKKILETDYRFELDLDDILEEITDKIVYMKIKELLEFYKYTKNPKFILDKIVNPGCLDRKKDFKIIEELEDIYNDKKLNEYVDWSNHLVNIDTELKDKIIFEIQRNKMIYKKEYKTFDYGFQEIKITDDEHYAHEDSKAYIYKKYLNKDIGPVPITLGDKIIRGLIKKPNTKKFTKQLVDARKDISKEDSIEHILCTGSDTFTDMNIVKEELNKLNSSNIKILSGVQFGADTLIAEYCLTNNIQNENVPHNTREHGSKAIFLNNRKMAEVCDRAIIFNDNNKETNKLIKYLKELGKDVQIHELKEIITIDEW